MARPVFIALGLLAFVSFSYCAHDVLRPRHNQLKPLKPLDDALIPGLLNRASTCTTCGIGGVCCSGGGCCGVAQRFVYSPPPLPLIKFISRCCSDGGCCQISEFCDTVDGVEGCCPVGSVCTAAPTSSIHTSATPTHSALSNFPTPTAGTHDIVLDMSAPTGLTFSGDWKSTTSSCNSSATSKTISSDGITLAEFSDMSYTFKGSAIYMKTSSINTHYTVILDSDITVYGTGVGLSNAPPNCTYGWWRDNLDSTSHFLTIYVYGGANSTPIGARAVLPYTFELQNLVITQPGTGSSSASSPSSSSPSSGSGSGSESGSGSGSSGNGALTTAGLSSGVLCLIFGLWTAFLHRL
ncbi:hypothetical protein B0H19DRAFT_1126255 [Mycena capillaripes]|nr:hypothetical protein B0H19DRAFT_1126255 [Mycena capillaripes]